MKMKKISASILFLLFVPLWLISQENVDLGMIYKIKQEGLKNSQIEELAFWLTDFVGPRLTGSTGGDKGNQWAKKKMEELGIAVPANLQLSPEAFADMVKKACRIAFEEGFVRSGGGAIITAGVPLGSPGTTNMVRIAFIDERGAPIAEEV